SSGDDCSDSGPASSLGAPVPGTIPFQRRASQLDLLNGRAGAWRWRFLRSHQKAFDRFAKIGKQFFPGVPFGEAPRQRRHLGPVAAFLRLVDNHLNLHCVNLQSTPAESFVQRNRPALGPPHPSPEIFLYWRPTPYNIETIDRNYFFLV